MSHNCSQYSGLISRGWGEFYDDESLNGAIVLYVVDYSTNVRRECYVFHNADLRYALDESITRSEKREDDILTFRHMGLKLYEGGEVDAYQRIHRYFYDQIKQHGLLLPDADQKKPLHLLINIHLEKTSDQPLYREDESGFIGCGGREFSYLIAIDSIIESDIKGVLDPYVIGKLSAQVALKTKLPSASNRGLIGIAESRANTELTDPLHGFATVKTITPAPDESGCLFSDTLALNDDMHCVYILDHRERYYERVRTIILPLSKAVPHSGSNSESLELSDTDLIRPLAQLLSEFYSEPTSAQDVLLRIKSISDLVLKRLDAFKQLSAYQKATLPFQAFIHVHPNAEKECALIVTVHGSTRHGSRTLQPGALMRVVESEQRLVEQSKYDVSLLRKDRLVVGFEV